MFRPSPIAPPECADLQAKPMTMGCALCKKKCCKKFKKGKRCKSCPGRKKD